MQLDFDFDEYTPPKPTKLINRYRANINGEHVSYLDILHGVRSAGSTAWGDTLDELREELDRDWCAKRAYYEEDCDGCSVEIEIFEQTLDMARPHGERWVSERMVERITL